MSSHSASCPNPPALQLSQSDRRHGERSTVEVTTVAEEGREKGMRGSRIPFMPIKFSSNAGALNVFDFENARGFAPIGTPAEFNHDAPPGVSLVKSDTASLTGREANGEELPLM